jgi:hypothetical protein
MTPFYDIRISVIPHDKQRYDTAGDWRTYDHGDWVIGVSDLGDPRYNLLIAVHELVEMVLCLNRGISQEAVDQFDMNYSGMHADDPGDDPAAPYHKEHMAATAIERLMAVMLDVNWAKYQSRFNDLSR